MAPRDGVLAISSSSSSSFFFFFFFFSYVAHVSHASLFWRPRFLVDVAPKDNTTSPSAVSPLPFPAPPAKTSDSGSKKDNNPRPPSANPPSKSKVDSTAPPPAISEPKKKDGTIANPNSDNGETCDGVPKKCSDRHNLVACIQENVSGSRDLAVLVQNEGESTLKVNLTAGNVFKELEIPEHQTKKINITVVSKSTELVFSAGNGYCTLHSGPIVSEGNIYLHLPSFDQLLTPINGAYLLILTVIIFGGTCACCCKFRKKRQEGGVLYQELEMGPPERGSATASRDVETAEGWDQGWDDDWDDNNALKSPVGHCTVGSISANGLTARSSAKDGWENDWDA